ncbi:hypothetical protein [Oceanomicrobium pacificus]|uniref:Uncharacterized protein n=1 Tax=Oceanomicrobium pacificus TaxID=2692916 RepID=A0A6B0TNL2_9RHOB|nr:hypothetical protein [Oceanomicrobium pacificus]MXU66200.1 hypothetical protein [Oceanomicrobium pacificus]
MANMVTNFIARVSVSAVVGGAVGAAVAIYMPHPSQTELADAQSEQMSALSAQITELQASNAALQSDLDTLRNGVEGISGAVETVREGISQSATSASDTLGTLLKGLESQTDILRDLATGEEGGEGPDIEVIADGLKDLSLQMESLLRATGENN